MRRAIPVDELDEAPQRLTRLGRSREALMRLPGLDIYELREKWRNLYKTDPSPHLSRELLIRAVAYRMQEVALGGLRPELQLTCAGSGRS